MHVVTSPDLGQSTSRVRPLTECAAARAMGPTIGRAAANGCVAGDARLFGNCATNAAAGDAGACRHGVANTPFLGTAMCLRCRCLRHSARPAPRSLWSPALCPRTGTGARGAAVARSGRPWPSWIATPATALRRRPPISLGRTARRGRARVGRPIGQAAGATGGPGAGGAQGSLRGRRAPASAVPPGPRPTPGLVSLEAWAARQASACATAIKRLESKANGRTRFTLGPCDLA